VHHALLFVIPLFFSSEGTEYHIVCDRLADSLSDDLDRVEKIISECHTAQEEADARSHESDLLDELELLQIKLREHEKVISWCSPSANNNLNLVFGFEEQ